MLKLPKEHLSVSQINLWESDPIAYQKKYFIGIPDDPSPFLDFGKQFAKDIEDYAAGVQRDFNFPEGFIDMTLIYPHVEYKLEHDFGDFKMLGYIDNMSKDYELVVDFKTGTAPWSTQRLQQSLQMQTYSLILWYKFKVMPTSVISYWKTKLRGKTLSWAGEHESFMYVFDTLELNAAEARIRKAAKEISEAYERYNDSVIGEKMFKYAEITKELKELEKKKELIKLDLNDLLKDNKMAMDVHGALVSYTTYQRKSYTFSKNIVNKEYEIEAMKKEEINTGAAEEHSKTVTLILVKDERVEH
jgi:hypothetical protein